MELRIDSKLLDEQIALCEKYEFYGLKSEQDLFGGIAGLLTEIDAALTAGEIIKFCEFRKEE
jgi:hypothetical protein